MAGNQVGLEAFLGDHTYYRLVPTMDTRSRKRKRDMDQHSHDVNSCPVKIHGYSVEEYQQIYHEVVDDMLKYKNGRDRPYSLELGRRIKQKLWERMNRPKITSTNQDELVHVDVSYGVGVHPPLHDIDTTEEPTPEDERREKRQRRSSNTLPPPSPQGQPDRGHFH